MASRSVVIGRACRAISLGCLSLLSLGVSGDGLERIDAVAQGGATELALRLLAKQQPSLDQQDDWIQWEKRRIAILAETERWDEIALRADQLPVGLPEPFIRWALMQAANAQLTAENGAAARRYLRRLIWGHPADTNEFARWRRLVVRSYLLDGDVSDAHTALLRYKQDYRVNNDAWRLLHARVLLRAGRNKAAFDVLEDTQSLEGKSLRSLAGLRSGIYKATAVKAEGLKLVEATRGKPELNQQAWALVAEAAAQAGDDVYRVIGLEHALALPGKKQSNHGVFDVRADDLWQAYEWLAETLGNRMQLLVGNDQTWLEQADYYQSEERSYSRSLYAFLTRRGSDPAARREAHTRLTDSLFADGRDMVVQRLYTRSKRFGSLESIPEPVRYRLADMALKRRDIHFAARLLQGLDKPPEGGNPDLWSLRRARVLIYAGDFKEGALWLSQILDHKRVLDSTFADRYIQVLFDLQAVDKHAEAYVLLDSVYGLVENPRQRREILFWMADSKKALGEYQEAAELYLRSAHYPPSKGKDPWGHSARFYAAEALGKAGLVADARGVYRKLLAETADRRRRAVVERHIQQLWLREQQATTR
ncbi:MAG: tol-pal system YbgF family protein [Acidiferrobacterales bacterium]